MSTASGGPRPCPARPDARRRRSQGRGTTRPGATRPKSPATLMLRADMTTTPHRPRFDEFARWAAQAPCVPVYRQLTGDGLTPVSAFRRIAQASPSFLFESVIGGEKVGRFSFLGSEPFLIF